PLLVNNIVFGDEAGVRVIFFVEAFDRLEFAREGTAFARISDCRQRMSVAFGPSDGVERQQADVYAEPLELAQPHLCMPALIPDLPYKVTVKLIRHSFDVINHVSKSVGHKKLAQIVEENIAQLPLCDPLGGEHEFIRDEKPRLDARRLGAGVERF